VLELLLSGLISLEKGILGILVGANDIIGPASKRHEQNGRFELLAGTTPLGAKIKVRYSRSTAYPNKRLPFNVDVVSGLGISLGGGTDRQTTYSYAGGYFDVVGREVKGFASVTAVEQDASRSGPLRKQYTYDQGLKGELSSGEKWGLTGKLLSAETRE